MTIFLLFFTIARALANNPGDLELQKQIAYTWNGLGLICMNSEEYDQVIDFVLNTNFNHSVTETVVTVLFFSQNYRRVAW